MIADDSVADRAVGGKKRAVSFLSLITSVGVALWLVWTSRGDLVLVAGFSAWSAVLMISAHGLSLVTQSERFRLILQQHARARFPPLPWMRLFIRGRLFSMAVPQSGHFYRGLALRQAYGTPGLRYLSSLATQTWLALAASLVFAALLAWFFVRRNGSSRDLSVAALAVSALLVSIAPYLITRVWRFLPGRWRSMRLARRAREVWVLGVRTARDRRLVIGFLALVLLGLLAASLGLRIAFSIPGQKMEWEVAMAIMALVHLGNVVSITPSNLGVQELGIAGLAGLFGYPAASGVLASVVVRISNLVALVLLATIVETVGMARRQ